MRLSVESSKMTRSISGLAPPRDQVTVVPLGFTVRSCSPALVLLTPEASPAELGFARDSGAMVHLVEPVAAQSLAAAVWVSAARARDLQDLSSQLTELRESFESRKVIERAKAVLMRRLEMSEEEAHRRLQTESRNRNRKLVETAWHVIRADGYLERSGAKTQEEGVLAL